jgi:hypothetical protein
VNGDSNAAFVGDALGVGDTDGVGAALFGEACGSGLSPPLHAATSAVARTSAGRRRYVVTSADTR